LGAVGSVYELEVSVPSHRILTVVCLTAFTWIAGSAAAVEFPGPNPPGVFDGGGMGIDLAMEMAGSTDAMPALENVAENYWPWGSGFEFPGGADANPNGGIPSDLPDVVYEKTGLSGDAAGDLSGGAGDGGAGGGLSLVLVPEPEPALLLALGLAAFAWRRRASA
jgi:hypothetical protein